MPFKRSTSCHLLWSRAKMKGRPYLEAKDYKSFYAKKLRIFSKCLKSEFSCQLQEDTTPCSSFQIKPFQAHCDPCNLSFPKSPHLHHKGSWAKRTMDQKLTCWDKIFTSSQNLFWIVWLLRANLSRDFHLNMFTNIPEDVLRPKTQELSEFWVISSHTFHTPAGAHEIHLYLIISLSFWFHSTLL